MGHQGGMEAVGNVIVQFSYNIIQVHKYIETLSFIFNFYLEVLFNLLRSLSYLKALKKNRCNNLESKTKNSTSLRDVINIFVN